MHFVIFFRHSILIRINPTTIKGTRLPFLWTMCNQTGLCTHIIWSSSTLYTYYLHNIVRSFRQCVYILIRRRRWTGTCEPTLIRNANVYLFPWTVSFDIEVSVQDNHCFYKRNRENRLQTRYAYWSGCTGLNIGLFTDRTQTASGCLL